MVRYEELYYSVCRCIYLTSCHKKQGDKILTRDEALPPKGPHIMHRPILIAIAQVLPPPTLTSNPSHSGLHAGSLHPRTKHIS